MPIPFLGPFHPAAYAFVAIRRPAETALLSRLRMELDEGEAQALALANELDAELVLIDERPARRAADKLGLRTAGVLALLLRAKAGGLVREIAPLIDRLDATIRFRASADVRERVLRDAGEWP